MLEKLELGLLVTVFAMLIVFAVLYVIQLVIKIQTYLLKDVGEHKKENTVINVIPKEEMVIQEVKPVENDLEVVAAIMAALSAYTGKSSDELNIRSIKRVNANSNWRSSSLQNLK